MTPSPDNACALECYCGQVWTGVRSAEAQVVTCAACGRRQFVFPAAPWAGKPGAASAPSRPHMTRRDWVKLVAATLVTALLLIGFLVAFLEMRRPATPTNDDTPRKDARGQLTQADEWLSQGQFRRAARLLADVEHSSAGLSGQDLASVRQWRREAEVLADLIHEPLDALLEHAAAGAEAEWLEEFAARYQGKSVLLDAEFFPADEEWKVQVVLDRAGKGQISLKGVSLFERCPERKRQRLIVGLRLASIRLEPPGPSWVIRFEPEGGVFLTHSGAAAHACPPLAEKDGQEVLQRQREWVFR